MAQQSQTLLLTDAPVLEASLLLRISQSLGNPVESVSVASSSGKFPTAALQGRTFATVVSLANSQGFHASGGLLNSSSLVAPGGRLLVQEPSGPQVICCTIPSTSALLHFRLKPASPNFLYLQEGLCKALLLSGFVNARPAQALAGHPTESAVSPSLISQAITGYSVPSD